MSLAEKKCDKCDGKLTRICSLCKGSGRIIERINLTLGWNMENISLCPLCHGEGKLVTECDVSKNK